MKNSWAMVRVSELVLHIRFRIIPHGLADAFIIGEEFIGNDSVCLILGDNIFYGQSIMPVLQEAASIKSGAKIFGYPVKNPKEFGVVEFDNDHNVISIEEKLFELGKELEATEYGKYLISLANGVNA